MRQIQYLDRVAAVEIPAVAMSADERDEKEMLRASLEGIIQQVCSAHPKSLPPVYLQCFGSFVSGFATAGSDMDLVTVLPDGDPHHACFSLMENDLPRVLEKRLLELGYGARLLTRTRVPIIKVCEKPGEVLLGKLREERERWDVLPDEEKYPHLHPLSPDVNVQAEQGNDANPAAGQERKLKVRLEAKPFTRERKAGPLEFVGNVGIQCDVNFFNPLAIHNTQLLKCYSACDARVKPMVLFIKAWAKRRKINSSYSGTLSSYGYVLMVLHYLINIANPPVLHNLQGPWRPSMPCTPPGATRVIVDGWPVDFWSNEVEIAWAAQNKMMTTNTEPLGSLLTGFFDYFSSQNGSLRYNWMQDVISLRTHGGILRKDKKGWTKAVTEESNNRKVHHRYLLCIEDPFELTHNVARTVTHYGIVAIRDEFRRAARILHNVGQNRPCIDGELLAQMVE
ncbi:PAP/OAS1 substrate-binding domain-containing protein [Piedraia hortae CBS 480.64]|uniref:polynucleotide adenylyltransferase n=1 Tax=Piedraia hortae CBS 480.64 TaxID=1314780 RepID=A0A6A7BXY2_9PEZI|nr:PAP/OAS1 substrate-binding domain-containing protein [Piedraia hortae CBS 480.64]